MVKWVIIGILLLPVAEIAAFVLMAAMIGMLWTLLLMLATTLAGALVLRCAAPGANASPASGSRWRTPTSPASRPTPAVS